MHINIHPKPTFKVTRGSMGNNHWVDFGTQGSDLSIFVTEENLDVIAALRDALTEAMVDVTIGTVATRGR